MGNTLGGKKCVKVMKINGETIKFKTPIQAGEVTKDYPGHVVLESETVKQFGIHAKPLDAWQELKRNRLYFVVELPKVQQQQEDRPRRVRSGGINMTAKDRLESLKLYRRSVSNITIVPPPTHDHLSDGGLRVKMRLSKAEVERLMRECKDEGEVAEKIVRLCTGGGAGGGGSGREVGTAPPRHRHVQWDPVIQV